MTEIDQSQVKLIVLKLLDKAGNDPRLTPRILRNKVEDKMNLERGSLKVKRDYIKTLIFKWWKVNHPESTIRTGSLSATKATATTTSSVTSSGNSNNNNNNNNNNASTDKVSKTKNGTGEQSDEDKEYKALIRIAKAGDKWPLLGKGISELGLKEKKSELRKR